MVTILAKQCPGQAKTATHKFKEPALTKNKKMKKRCKTKEKINVKFLRLVRDTQILVHIELGAEAGTAQLFSCKI